MDEQETQALIERTRVVIAEMQQMLDDRHAYVRRFGIDPDLYERARNALVSPAVQAEVDKQVRQDLEAIENNVVAAMRTSTGARKVVGKKTRKLI